MYGGLITILEELEVENIIIGEQFEINENYKEFLKIVKNKNIKIEEVEAGDKLVIDKEVYFNILWPDNKNMIEENVLNNNSLVCKLIYKNFSILFTGDIEEIAENEIVNMYSKIELKSTVLKVAHHGSKTSSTKKFLEFVQPKIALIGVGKNNTFGHPNEEVIIRLNNLDTNIFRTDENGEIDIVVDNDQKVRIKSFIK